MDKKFMKIVELVFEEDKILFDLLSEYDNTMADPREIFHKLKYKRQNQ